MAPPNHARSPGSVGSGEPDESLGLAEHLGSVDGARSGRPRTVPSSRFSATVPLTVEHGAEVVVGDDDRAGEADAVLDDGARVADPVGDHPARRRPS